MRNGISQDRKRKHDKEGMTLVFYEKLKETRKGWKKWEFMRNYRPEV